MMELAPTNRIAGRNEVTWRWGESLLLDLDT